jgi:hypothetical protein
MTINKKRHVWCSDALIAAGPRFSDGCFQARAWKWEWEVSGHSRAAWMASTGGRALQAENGYGTKEQQTYWLRLGW